MRLITFPTALVVLAALAAGPVFAAPPAAPKPLLRDFIGLNVHTVLFKPDLYRPIARLLRDYHGFDWDMGADTDYFPQFPFARNRVSWEDLYGAWTKAGYEVDVSVMVDGTPPASWKNLPEDAWAYGFYFARYFGPSGPRRFAASMEIGNEPGKYDDAAYRTLFENMARGLRKGDPKLRIVTCATTPGKSGDYAKSLSCVQGLESLYDVINLHTYAQVEGYPTWRRSYPEDPKIAYLKEVGDVIAWRNAHAPGKPVWITEFGWDATTQPAPKEGTFKDWVGSTETEQARYLVRSFLVFSEMDVDRAYVYWFNDDDKPQVHGSSGLTRNYNPKPAFHAMAHLQATLGAYRFARTIVKKPGDLYVYEYQHGTDAKQRIWAAWSPTGADRREEKAIPAPPGTIVRAERMPLAPGPAETVRAEVLRDKTVRLSVDESPVFLWLRLP